ncbi:hypothetical protein [Pseudomonas sp. BE134]|uniref:hypothetical protein n=1 Tax=Pseudomonas sp. BE134 TaxID=2817843 RepID=UPI00285D798F|nr:hypothetical protein [Pseudomonas sp. BE134]MDR6927852.1 hypothetical protein [Pseudomonas sp. BE134]
MTPLTDQPKNDKLCTPKLSELAPGSILNFNPSDFFAVVAVQRTMSGEIQQHRVEMPEQFKSCPVFLCLIRYLNSATFKKTTPHNAYSRVLRFKSLEKWAITEYPSASTLPAAFMQDYVRYLRTVKELEQNSLCVYMSGYRTAFEWYIEDTDGDPLQSAAASKIKEVMAFIPSVSNRAGRVTKSLGQITNQSEKDELKIVRSTIRFCCQFLKEMNRQRLELLTNPDVMSKLAEMLSECRDDFEQLKFSTKNTKRSALYRPLASAILESDNLQLKERLLHNQVDFCYSQIEQGLSITFEDANRLIKRGLSESGALDLQPLNGDHTLYFHNIDYLFLIKHTPSEELAFAWLLATDRVQLTGVLEMLVGDLRITPNAASPIYIKNRSGKRVREVPAHPPRSMQYEAYSVFDLLKRSFIKFFPLSSENLFDLPTSSNIQCIDSAVFRPLAMASYPQTAQYKAQVFSDREVELFSDIVRRVSANNRSIWRNIKTRRENSSRGIRGANPTPVKRQTITLTAVAQSRAILDIDDGVTPNEAFEKYSQDVVGADATAHSLGVKQVVYINASETKYRLDKRAKFASSVGHLMVEDARKVQAALREENFISIVDLKIMLGWAEEKSEFGEMEEFDSLLLSAQQAGFTLSPFGKLEKGDNTFIITNSITAALLISYRDACIAHLQCLTVADDLKAFSIAMQVAYIENVLEKFDQKTIIQGEEIMKNYTFPSPIIR